MTTARSCILGCERTSTIHGESLEGMCIMIIVVNFFTKGDKREHGWRGCTRAVHALAGIRVNHASHGPIGGKRVFLQT